MNITPDSSDLWAGIGGTFDTFDQVASEFIDNSIANCTSNKISNTNIIIKLNKLDEFDKFKDKKFKLLQYTQEDAGTGIKNIEKSLTIGNIDMRENILNEHGFGMKHGFASANPMNDNWFICTRTEEDIKKGMFKRISAPYTYNMNCEEVFIKNEPWPGEFNGTGTIISFKCTEDFFYTIRLGVSGSGRSGLKKCLDYFCEDLGFKYSKIIKNGKVSLIVKSDNICYEPKKDTYYCKIPAVEPSIIGYYDPKSGTTNLDLGNGDVQIEYQFCEINEANHHKYYLKNQATAGAEIRINGRVILKNVFKDIWGIEMHPCFNHFLILINIISNDRDKLPRTRTTKNGIRLGDEKLDSLYEWIRKAIPNPPRLSSGAVSESELLDELKKIKDTHLPSNLKKVTREFNVFTSIGCNVKVDLYVFDGQDLIIFEGKKDDADIQSVYQLRLYWDGCICDGIKPNKGVLIASNFSDGINKLINHLNSLQDANGNYYNIITKTWIDENISYPK